MIKQQRMSFRNNLKRDQESIKIEEENSAPPSRSSNYPIDTLNSNINTDILSKLADIIVNLHENYLLKCQNIQIYRDLNAQEQELLIKADKNTLLHTVLAGAMAIDSCVKAIEREEQFAVSNIVRANSGLISNFKDLERELKNAGNLRHIIEETGDSINFLSQQLKALPSFKGKQVQLERQLTLLQQKNEQKQGQIWLKQEHTSLLSQLQRENEMVKLAIREKDSYIKSLEGALERVGRLQKKQQRKTAHSLGLRMKTEKSSENQSQSQTSLQQAYDQLSRLKQELLEKNNIVIRMNEEFASEMEKYNSVFKRLEQENRVLKKYCQIDTAYLLEELEMEIDNLRDQKHKDQLIISDIQRKLQAFSFSRSRLTTDQSRGPNYPPSFQNYQPPYHHQATYNNQLYPQTRSPPPQQFYERGQNRYPNKFYSPNYSSRVAPYQRVSPYRQEGYYPQQPGRTRVSRREQFKTKSRSRLQVLPDSREKQPLEPKSTPTLNLMERVISKGY